MQCEHINAVITARVLQIPGKREVAGLVASGVVFGITVGVVPPAFVGETVGPVVLVGIRRSSC